MMYRKVVLDMSLHGHRVKQPPQQPQFAKMSLIRLGNLFWGTPQPIFLTGPSSSSV